MYTKETADKKLEDLFDALVPAEDNADTVAGEIVRAINRILYRNWNDGDHLGVGYGKETCNPAGRFLKSKCGGKVAECVTAAWGIYSDSSYDTAMEKLEIAVCEYLDAHPELQETPNTDDMWDWYDRHEDVDDSNADDYDDWDY